LSAEAGKLDVVKCLVKRGAEIDRYDQWSQTPLVMAAFSGQTDLFRYLLDRGAEPVLKREGAAQPIHRAVQTGSDEIIKLLLGLNVPVNVPDDIGVSPMGWAIINGNLPVLDMLLSHLKDQKITDKLGRSLLHIAAYHGKEDIVDYLIGHKYSVQDTDSNNWNVLHWAAYGNQGNMVKYFIERNAAINETDIRGRTPLQIAAIRGNIPIIEMLAARKADFDVKDTSGLTPLELASKYGRMDATNALRSKYAKEEKKDFENFSSDLLNKPLEADEAIIWYLGHAGFAVKTKNHFLIFDYMGERQMPSHPGLANGAINPDEIKNEAVSVFVSHQHSDHYFRGILGWKNSIRNIRYFFGWKEFDTSEYHCFSKGRETKKVNALEVTNIAEQHDDVPESAFLVKADDVVIFHTGDYVGSFDTFKDDLKFLAEKYGKVDISFMFLAGDTTVQSANIMQPKIAFPMHGFMLDYLYKNFPEKIEKASPSTKTFCPEFEGDVFFYKN
jgi:ankyrin repeat protein/L-ascorbate metabolism protein UlaG (beta-lactamase superfamily)